MNNIQAQNGNTILNHLCKFINNRPVAYTRIARDLKLDIHELESCISEMMHIHPEWYTIQKKMFGGQAVMLNAPALKEIHKFLVLGGYAEMAQNTPAPKAKEAKSEEKAANVRNTVIIKPRLGLNHS